MDYVLGIDVYSLNSPDDTTNAGDPSKIDPVTKKNVVDPVRAAANWKAVYDAGIRFAYIKATEYKADTGYAGRMQYAKNAGLLRGPYILPHFELDNIADQVNLFVQTVGADQGELPPMLDLESPGGNWPVGRPLFAKFKLALDLITKAFNRRPIIYTSQSIVRQFQIINPPWGQDYDIWVAAYPWAPGTQLQYSDISTPPAWSSTYPLQPDGYKPWVIWQWTSKGVVPGMKYENADVNLFKGTYDSLLKWANAKVSTPAPTPQPLPQPQPGPNPLPQPQPQPAPAGNFITYTVVTGDTLGGLAIKFHTTVDAIMAANPDQIKSRSYIAAGWVIKIPNP